MQTQQELLTLLEKREQHLKYNKIDTFKPYDWQTKFWSAGKDFMERALIAANRSGKTDTAALEVARHATGVYPKDWKGHKFPGPIEIWVAGDTTQTTKGIIQKRLLGHIDDLGTGYIPRDCLLDKDGDFNTARKAGASEGIETARVKHVSGGVSRIVFKSYEQGRKAFQGEYIHLIWLDEEPSDSSIYSECLTRIVNDVNPGLIICTFTPLSGRSTVVKDFLPHNKFPKDNITGFKWVQNVTWDDIKHLTEKQKQMLLAQYSPHEREARSRGVPSLGAGAIYPYFEDQITYDPTVIIIPPWWPKVYGLDTGWKKTAVVWGAINPDEGVVYIYSEHYQGKAHQAIHASAIKSRGDWITGVADAQGINQSDGTLMLDAYRDEGLILEKANKKNVESGILKVNQMFECGKLKISTSCRNLLNEINGYTRDVDGKIDKNDDHACDALRYLIDTGLDYATCEEDHRETESSGPEGLRDRYTGY